MQRVTQWGGRMWVTLRIPGDTPAGPLRSKDLGCNDPDRSLIMYRTINPDTDIITLLHEISHIAYPNATEEDIQRGDTVLKDALEGFGVDLSPMLKGFKKA